MQSSFGTYLRATLKEKQTTLCAAANAMELSVPYLSDVCRGMRAPLSVERIDGLVQWLRLPDDKRVMLHQLAASDRAAVTLRVDHSRDDLQAAGLLSVLWDQLSQQQLDELATLLESWL
jgi:transcriptional regulator with XRE-family HTH domain